MDTDFMRLIQIRARAHRDLHEGYMCDRVRAIRGDPLRARMLVLYSHGRETLINFIFGAHGRNNKYL